MATPARRPDDDPSGDDATAVADLVAILRTAGNGARTLGGAGLSAVADGTEAAVAAFVAARVRRAVDRAASGPPPPLAQALAAPRTSALTKRLGTSGVSRLARRAGPIARRSPTAIALRVGPALYELGTSVVRELDAIAATLAVRALDDRREPDAEAVHTITVQLLTDRPVDPTVRPPHNALVKRWLRRAGGQLAPFGLGGGGVDAATLSAAIADVDPADLGPKRRRRSS